MIIDPGTIRSPTSVPVGRSQLQDLSTELVAKVRLRLQVASGVETSIMQAAALWHSTQPLPSQSGLHVVPSSSVCVWRVAGAAAGAAPAGSPCTATSVASGGEEAEAGEGVATGAAWKGGEGRVTRLHQQAKAAGSQHDFPRTAAAVPPPTGSSALQALGRLAGGINLRHRQAL